MNTILLCSILISTIAGIVLLAWSLMDRLTTKNKDVKQDLQVVHCIALSALLISGILALMACFLDSSTIVLFHLLKDVPIALHLDGISKWFVGTVTVVWILVGFYSVVYLKHEGEEKRFFGFYLVLYAVLIALDCAENLVTLYLFYELMSLVSFPLVLHNGSREAIMASLKYLFYSMCGAYMGLFGIFFLYRALNGNLSFVAGGHMTPEILSSNSGILLLAILIMCLGFSVKGGMFPLHAWLPTAHPVAPSPASAVLSGIIVKCGVLGILRIIYFVVGPSVLQGTYVMTVLMSLSLVTVFMGSLLAFREKVFKKRLAYSTVSQVSYILFGLFVCTPDGVTGALLHVLFHAIVKCGLFLVAGVFLFHFHITKVEDLRGMGKKMPITLWCYTFFALALVGIPPTSGFISKWYLAQGALSSTTGFFRFLGPVVLLISALLTAGYLLPITMHGFFTEEAPEEVSKKEPSPWMLLPLIVLAFLALGMGLFPNPFIQFASDIANTLW